MIDPPMRYFYLARAETPHLTRDDLGRRDFPAARRAENSSTSRRIRDEDVGTPYRFAVRYSVSPAPELKGALPLRLRGARDSTVTLRNLPIPEGRGAGVAAGIQVDVEVKAGSVEQAVWNASSVVNGLVSEIAAASATRCGMPLEIVAVQLESDSGDFDFREFVVVGQEISRRRLDPTLLQSVRKAIWRLPKMEQAAIWRSLESYNQALATLDAMVAFLILWVTVEGLKRALGIRA